MPPLQQPGLLLSSGISAASQLIISHTLASPHPEQEVRLRELVLKLVPPPLLQEVLHCALRQLAVHHARRASPTVIAGILRTLTHPRLKELHLSDLTYIGSVELQTLDKMESILIQLLPSMTKLTQLDISTHRCKITLPSCSAGVLQVLGSSCPNLTLLNLNNNNRVTSDGLLHLYPTHYQPGCVKLEKLFIQDCSVEPEDVAMLIHFFPNLKLVGYKELGTSIQIIKSQPKKFGNKKRKCQYNLKLTHVDNTMSRVKQCDGEIVDFLCDSCPDLENLKIRVCDEDVGSLEKLPKLKHLELRFYTGVHHPIRTATVNYIRTQGVRLASLTIYCDLLYSNHVRIIAENCCNLTKLFLHANTAVANNYLAVEHSKMERLEVLSLRLGHDELIMSPAANDLVMFLVREAPVLQELYLLLRSPRMTHQFITELLGVNRLSHLKTLIADAPRRTLVAPMLELTIETALLLISSCSSLQTLGNLISWNVTPQSIAELQEMKRVCNYDLTIVCSHSNKLNDKLF